MAYKKDRDSFINIPEVYPDHFSQKPATLPVVAEWPSNPQPLGSNVWVERGLDAYDIALCLTPVALMVEAILCIVAAYQDRTWTGFWVDGVGDLTRQLIRFNGQVSMASSYTLLSTDSCL